MLNTTAFALIYYGLAERVNYDNYSIDERQKALNNFLNSKNLDPRLLQEAKAEYLRKVEREMDVLIQSKLR